MNQIRVGFGLDVHKLCDGGPLIIGGISVPHNKMALGHSDADVLIHAICDALLGAANLRDIGFHFSDTDAAYKGIDSKILLKNTIDLLAKHSFVIGNIDSTIALQKPKIASYIEQMKNILAETMGIQNDQISIKATTTEKLGFEGREEGISAYAVCLIQKK